MILNKVIYRSVTVFDLVTAGVILIIAAVIAKVVSLYLRRLLKERIAKQHLEIIAKVVSYSIIVIALLTALPMLGLRLSGLLVAGGIIGLAVGFASQSIIGNLISGLFLMVERPIKIGNGVDIDGIVGIVEDIRIMSTTLRMYDGLYVRLPNQKVFTSRITNFSANVARRFQYLVGIRYSDDADKASSIIKSLIDKHPLALKNPEPQVFVDNLGDNAVNLIVRIWSPATEWYGVKMELLWRIKQALEKEGIEIAFPQQVVWFANELRKREITHSELRDTDLR
jgi:small-conductance mechanosensitive channel